MTTKQATVKRVTVATTVSVLDNKLVNQSVRADTLSAIMDYVIGSPCVAALQLRKVVWTLKSCIDTNPHVTEIEKQAFNALFGNMLNPSLRGIYCLSGLTKNLQRELETTCKLTPDQYKVKFSDAGAMGYRPEYAPQVIESILNIVSKHFTA